MKLQLAFAVAAFATVASAQQADRNSLPIRGGVHYAGTWDMATQTLIPPTPGQMQAVGPDRLYSNTCLVAGNLFYSALGTNQTRIDDGRIPSKSSTPVVGAVNTYRV